MGLSIEQQQMLEEAAQNGGRLSVANQSPGHMRKAAGAARMLEGMSLVECFVHNKHGAPDLVVVELTEEGRRYLAEQE